MFRLQLEPFCLTERRTVIRQTVPTKDPVEAETSTLIRKKVVYLMNYYYYYFKEFHFEFE